MTKGIRDKVVVVGMGCTNFGERWDLGGEELIVEAFQEALEDSGLEKREIQAAWIGTHLEEIGLGKGAIPLSVVLRLPNIPVTRVENYCASGAEALRGACYAVASGSYDVALALGVEKLKDTGYGGLPNLGSNMGTLNWQWAGNLTTVGVFAQLASAYSAKHNIAMPDVKKAMAHISAKSHTNAVHNQKAHLRKAVTVEQILETPYIAYPLGLYDCCGVSDGAACAIVTTPDIAKGMGKKDYVTVKSLQVAVSNGWEMGCDGWDGAHIITTEMCSKRAYEEAGITNPREEISMMEVHDCFSITELVTMEDLHISEQGKAIKDVLDGFFDLDGTLPCQPDGGLKCFGHPIGASGLRMLYEMYIQLLGRAGERQLSNPKYGLIHNLGGLTYSNVCSIAIVGRHGEG